MVATTNKSNVIAGLVASAFKSDSWVNALTGLGGLKDKLTHLRVVNRDKTFDEEQLETLYTSDDLAARIVDVIPDEMLREGYEIEIGEDDEGESSDQASALIERLELLEADSSLVLAMKWGRLYGAGAIIIGAEDKLDPALPLNETNIQTIKFLNVVDLRDLTITEYYNDPYAPKFNKPKIFQVTHSGPTSNGTSYIHESRMIVFEGPATPWRKRLANRGFNYSVLERVSDVLQEFHTTWKSSAHLMTDMSQGVVSIDGLMGMIAGGQKDILMDRIQLMNMSRSVARLMVLDAEKEKFERHGTPINGVADILELAMIRIAGAAGPVPVSILFGQDPAGLNSTGDLQIRRYYDTIAASQLKDLHPQHRRLIRLVMLAKDSPTGGVEPDSWTLTYNSLWQMTDQEKADLRLTTVQADAVEIQSGTVMVDEVALARHTNGGFSNGAIQIDRDLRKLTLEEDRANAMKPEPPPVVPPTPAPVPV